LKKETKWNNLHGKILAENDQSKAAELRRQANLADYFVVSASAVTENGEIILCDASGTRTGPVLYSANHVIFVVGTQKIVRDLSTGLKRQQEYCLAIESARARVAYKVPGSAINNTAIISGSNPWGTPGRIHVIFVTEALGF